MREIHLAIVESSRAESSRHSMIDSVLHCTVHPKFRSARVVSARLRRAVASTVNSASALYCPRSCSRRRRREEMR